MSDPITLEGATMAEFEAEIQRRLGDEHALVFRNGEGLPVVMVGHVAEIDKRMLCRLLLGGAEAMTYGFAWFGREEYNNSIRFADKIRALVKEIE